MQQAIDFYEESEALFRLIDPLEEQAFDQKTQFKEWSINDVLGHLHMWNWAADLTLKDSEAFEAFLNKLVEALMSGTPLRQFEYDWRGGVNGRELLRQWHEFYSEMARRFEATDPKLRVKWFGPDMSVRSKMTARLMETWAHGQEVYDLLGVERENRDRIKNIAQLGVNTFGWTYKNRKMEVPDTIPYLRLTGPSGDIWEWNDPSDEEKVEGLAAEFCQVVTQVRHVEDTSLTMVGETAKQWMSIAQCFAGPPVDPPKPGTRYKQ